MTASGTVKYDHRVNLDIGFKFLRPRRPVARWTRVRWPLLASALAAMLAATPAGAQEAETAPGDGPAPATAVSEGEAPEGAPGQEGAPEQGGGPEQEGAPEDGGGPQQDGAATRAGEAEIDRSSVLLQAPPADSSASAASASAAAATDSDSAVDIPLDAEAEEARAEEAAYGAEVVEIVGDAPPGSAYALSEAELERFESDDVHKVLAAVPGVYIREEDGYGLRPNIGMRATGSERSAKIALMEDGVLIAPAPYSAPAAYYFPLVTRMQRVEVLKGPAAVRFGPNTVGGALNLITSDIPRAPEASVDLAGGSDYYGKAHLRYGDSREHLGWFIEGLKLRSDGFKQLDGGGDTGFDKHGAMFKLRVNTDPAAEVYHQLDLKLGYGDEVSNETYTGLTDEDFAANPYRRYPGTQRDRMEWRHTQAQLSHTVSFGGQLDVITTAYRNDFERAWSKLDGCSDSSSFDSAACYALIAGMAEAPEGELGLVLGTNDRSFVSQGIQTTARADGELFGLSHRAELGTRLHYDEALRYHYWDIYDMVGGAVMPSDEERVITLDSSGETLAWATHYQHRVTAGPVEVTAGVRAELIATTYTYHDMPERPVAEDDYFVLIPGGGVLWHALPALDLLAGMHRGFTPVSPGSPSEVEPEDSVNYEAGLRYLDHGVNIELIGFFSDYSNLVGTCSFSSGCTSEQLGTDFSGGEVDAYGLEALAASEPVIGAGLRAPLRLSYTLQRSIFQSSFTSGNPQWGDVRRGDEMPYLPKHQLMLQAGVSAPESWELLVSGRYVSAMRDVPGQPEDQRPSLWTDRTTVVDIAASYTLPRWGKLYLTVNNLLDEVHVAARRPYGARPGVPRQVVLGIKARI